MTIDALIDWQNNVQIIQTAIGDILLVESAAQRALAVAAAKDPMPWDIRVFTKRTNPWAEYIGAPDQGSLEARPIVNVWFDNSNVDMRASNVVKTQVFNGSFNIDCYGYGISKAVGTTAHVAGDAKAADESLRTACLVQNILMAAIYVHLGLSQAVTQRMVQGIEVFRPPQDERGAIHVVGHRVSLGVRFDEQSPQVTGQPLEEIGVTVLRKETGEIYLTADYSLI